MGKLKCSHIIAIIGWSISLLSIVTNILLANHNSRLQIELRRLEEPRPKEEIEILEDSTKINSKYKTEAKIKITNLGLRGEKDFKFEVEVDPYSEILSFERNQSRFYVDEKKSNKYYKTYMARLPGEGSIEGILTFVGHGNYFKGELAHPIKITFW